MMRIVVAVSLACVALGIQLLLTPVVAVDSYQLFLGAVAVSSIYGGWKAGLLTLLISGLGRFCFFMPADILTVDSELVVRTALFLAVAIVICWIGGRFHAIEQRLAAVLTSIADAVIATDDDGRIKFMNPAAEALSGWSQKAAVKRHVSEVIPLRDSASGAAVSLQHGDERGDIETGAVLDSKTGCAIPVSGSVNIMRGTGAKSGAVIVLRDLTERRQAEQDRERLLNEVRFATAKLKVLSGMLPICSGCKKIRDGGGRWHILEAYVEAHSGAEFSHGLCPECVRCALGSETRK